MWSATNGTGGRAQDEGLHLLQSGPNFLKSGEGKVGEVAYGVSNTAARVFYEVVRQAVYLITSLFLRNLVVRHGPLDLQGGGWEC